jgi:hypothetical protein
MREMWVKVRPGRRTPKRYAPGIGKTSGNDAYLSAIRVSHEWRLVNAVFDGVRGVGFRGRWNEVW